MTKIELIYDADCPNVDKARANLKKALVNLSVDNKWTEWERTQNSAPAYVQRYGSPTILIDENPIGKSEVNEEGNSCSIYLDEHGNMSRVPSINQIRTAIREVFLKRKKRPLIGIVSSSGASILALIPIISCPLCWPAYTALLSALGVGFFNYSLYLIFLLIGLIGFASFLLWRDYRFHNRLLPFLLALIGGTLVIIAKIIYPNDPLMFAGILSLVVASIVNIFYVKKMTKKLLQPCEGCCQKKEKKNE
ncbi:MAG: hypothetical protein K940chlam7_00448 [Chlamydiae bacterium]|nr:hypothetical protein [Chlamydiota bacterium]